MTEFFATIDCDHATCPRCALKKVKNRIVRERAAELWIECERDRIERGTGILSIPRLNGPDPDGWASLEFGSYGRWVLVSFGPPDGRILIQQIRCDEDPQTSWEGRRHEIDASVTNWIALVRGHVEPVLQAECRWCGVSGDATFRREDWTIEQCTSCGRMPRPKPANLGGVGRRRLGLVGGTW